MAAKTADIANLRALTGAGIMDCREALLQAKGDKVKAQAYLQKKGLARAVKKKGRETKAGLVYAYIHHSNSVGSLISIACETDFVAKTDQFKNLAKEIAMQIASMKPKSIEILMDQDYIREPTKKIQNLIDEAIGQLGENIRVIDFKRLEV